MSRASMACTSWTRAASCSFLARASRSGAPAPWRVACAVGEAASATGSPAPGHRCGHFSPPNWGTWMPPTDGSWLRAPWSQHGCHRFMGETTEAQKGQAVAHNHQHLRCQPQRERPTPTPAGAPLHSPSPRPGGPSQNHGGGGPGRTPRAKKLPGAAATLMQTLYGVAQGRGSPETRLPGGPAPTEAQPPLLPKDGLFQGTAVGQELPGLGRQAPLHHHLWTRGHGTVDTCPAGSGFPLEAAGRGRASPPTCGSPAAAPAWRRPRQPARLAGCCCRRWRPRWPAG